LASTLAGDRAAPTGGAKLHSQNPIPNSSPAWSRVPKTGSTLQHNLYSLRSWLDTLTRQVGAVLSPSITPTLSQVMAGAARASPKISQLLKRPFASGWVASVPAGDRAAPTGGAKLTDCISYSFASDSGVFCSPSSLALLTLTNPILRASSFSAIKVTRRAHGNCSQNPRSPSSYSTVAKRRRCA
jgi:hypothetical protein